MRPPRVLRIITRLNVGGPSFQAIRLNRELERRGFRTLLATGAPEDREGDLRDLARSEGVEVAPIPSLRRGIAPHRDLAALLQVAALIRRWKPDLIHTHMAKAGLIGRIAGWALGVAAKVHTFHGHVFRAYFSPGVSRGIVCIERALGRITDRVVAVGPTVADEIVRCYRIVPQDKVETIRIGVPLPPPSSGGNGPSAVGFAGRLAPVKDPALFVRTAACIRKEMPAIRFPIAGDGPLRESVRRVAQEKGVDGAFDFLGWTNDMGGFYGGIDLLLLTSRNEGTPRSILEAQAAGVPVVATDVGAVQDLLTFRREEGGLRICDEGILVPGRRPGDLARASLLLLRDSRLRRRMAEAARARIERANGEDREVTEMERLYRRLLQERGVV